MREPSALLYEEVTRQLERWSEAAYPNETGGVLLGILGDGLPWIVTAAQIPSAASQRFRYQLPPGQTHVAVERARRDDPRVGYLGDWHSHPIDREASTIDLATYLAVFARALRRREQPPLMVVMRRASHGWETDMLGRRGLLRPAARVSFVVTGPPPVP